MSKQSPPSTTDQIRKLMQRHVGKPTVATPRMMTRPVALSTPREDIPVIRTNNVATELPAPNRTSIRLLPTDLAKINRIINLTIEQIGERVTATDVLRTGLGRLGDSSHITRQEITALRAGDGRKKKLSVTSS